GPLRQHTRGASASVSVAEIYEAIRRPLEAALARARRLERDGPVHRVVLTGQSSWIPLVRRMFTRPRSEGGFGLAPDKVVFDAENAKAAVAKGACLLRVMRAAMVGFDVDVSEFVANLLADIWYESPLGGRRVLFGAGLGDELRFVEERPDPASFARCLSVFSDAPAILLGQFDFRSQGEPLPDFRPSARATAHALALPDDFPSHAELLELRAQ